MPSSTYRLQLHRGFRFGDAAALAPYLAALGVSHCYSSPQLKAHAGSTHGYDICDHAQLNPEIGTADEYAAFTAALHQHGLGQIVDFVPNHMSVDARSNAWWRDVLENGPCSPFADFFDIDWRPVKDELEQKLLLPILGDQYGLVLERGELRVAYAAGGFVLRYFDHDLPLNPRQTTRLLEHDVDRLREQLGGSDHDLVELLSVITALRNLPLYTETEPDRVAERQREKEVARERLDRLAARAPEIVRHIERAVAFFNGEPGRPETFDSLHELLETQPYRLAHWRTASHEINYRRFFDINQLAGLRMEDERVFEATHGLLLQLIAEGHVDGLRLDHIDGLFDPATYLARLQAAVQKARGDGGPLYVVVEKILSRGEALPAWPVAGTSGYDFLNDVNGLFVDGRGQRALERVYRRFTGRSEKFHDAAYAAKKLISDTAMSSELNVLAHALNRLSERDRRTRDFTLNSLRDALQEVAACFPIYRAYVGPEGYAPADREAIEAAVREARWRNPTMEPSILEFVRGVLLPPAGPSEPRLVLAMKFQQYSGPLEAKGVEDTAFYRHNLLVSLNEVGGDPERFGRPPAEFHAANVERRQRWPRAMLATSTHDTKRGEDARARLNALSEVAEDWGRQVRLWARINAGLRTSLEGGPAPDRNDEYLYYQALLGVWPAGAAAPAPDLVERLQAYMRKAVREAKVHSGWLAPNALYEEAVDRFVAGTLEGAVSRRFLKEFLPFQRRIARLGMINSLAQVVVKIASPGVPDIYQGCELWDLSLVDPDNRRPVDFERRARLLAEVEASMASGSAAWTAMLEAWEDGRVKLAATAAGLRCRRRRAAVFLEGDYVPLEIRGAHAESAVAFARVHGEEVVIALVPRLVAALTAGGERLPLGDECWADTEVVLPAALARRAFGNVLTGEAVKGGGVGALLSRCPVALLEAT